MEPTDILEFSRRSIILLLELCLPLLLIALVVGFCISLIQALTQIQEQTLSFVPKMVAVFVGLIFLMPYYATKLGNFTTEIMQYIVQTSS